MIMEKPTYPHKKKTEQPPSRNKDSFIIKSLLLDVWRMGREFSGNKAANTLNLPLLYHFLGNSGCNFWQKTNLRAIYCLNCFKNLEPAEAPEVLGLDPDDDDDDDDDLHCHYLFDFILHLFSGFQLLKKW